jgi:hypothetical protein
MLEVSRDAATAEEEKLVSCSAERSKYCSICTVTLGSCGDLPFTSWGRWQCRRGGAGGLNGFLTPTVSALIVDVGPCWAETCGEMLEAMARIAPSQPNEAMARIASRINRTTSLDPNLSVFNFRVGF